MKDVKTLSLCSVMVAVMLALGYLESLLPVSGVPGIKLGLSNCVLVIALYWLSFGTCFVMMAAKVALLGLILGNPMMTLYSLAGGTVSLCVMALMRRAKGVSPVGVGIAGGAAHNIGQVLAAMLALGTPSLITYLSILLPVGAGMGFITGTVAKLLLGRLKPPRQASHQ